MSHIIEATQMEWGNFLYLEGMLMVQGRTGEKQFKKKKRFGERIRRVLRNSSKVFPLYSLRFYSHY